MNVFSCVFIYLFYLIFIFMENLGNFLKNRRTNMFPSNDSFYSFPPLLISVVLNVIPLVMRHV